MRIILTAMVVSVLSILMFKYADRSIGADIFPDKNVYPDLHRHG